MPQVFELAGAQHRSVRRRSLLFKLLAIWTIAVRSRQKFRSILHCPLESICHGRNTEGRRPACLLKTIYKYTQWLRVTAPQTCRFEAPSNHNFSFIKVSFIWFFFSCTQNYKSKFTGDLYTAIKAMLALLFCLIALAKRCCNL